MTDLDDPGTAAGFDSILNEVLSQVDDVLHEQVRLRLLVDAVVSLAGDLTLDGVLGGIVETARRLVDARAAAIAVHGAAGGPLAMFEHRGLDDAAATGLATLSATPRLREVARAGAAPTGRDRLLALADEVGVPRGTLPGRALLGVPVRTRTEVLGVLYLADRVDDAARFSEHDESLLVALATAAGVAIENARLHEAATRRQRWLEATARSVSLLAGSGTSDHVLTALADHARRASGADVAWVAVGDSRETLTLRVVTGVEVSHDVLPLLDLGRSLVGEAVATGGVLAVDDLWGDERVTDTPPDLALPPLGPAVVAPLQTPDGVEGALGLAWTPQRAGDPGVADTAQVAAFAEQSALALRVARSREETQRLAVFEDRHRIGADLHELVIQRLFGIGLGIESAARLTDRPAVRERLSGAVDGLDAAIRDLRRSIFALDDPGATTDPPADGRPS